METILIGSDHAGFSLKAFLKEVMEQDGSQVVDVGCAADVSCDYPDYARLLCERI
jgi:ribose 5-phosphate isomerase B